MKHCCTKTGTLRLYHEGKDFLLDCAGLDLPEELAESIRTHVNVVVDGPPPEPPKAEEPASEEEAAAEAPEGAAEEEPRRPRRSRRADSSD